MNKMIIEEAINELRKNDNPNLYRRVRRWARQYIKRESVAPIDIISWPKGCLLVGLMHQAMSDLKADNSPQRANAIKCMAEVKDYFDKWIKAGAGIYTVDDCLSGEALLMFAGMYEPDDQEYDLYMSMADKMMNFLFSHDKDKKGSLPYRPGQKTGQIFADGAGMAAPFAIHYGIIRKNEDAIELGLNQITNFMCYGIDKQSGLPWHAYALNDSGDDAETFGAIGWGRAVGWITYGIEESLYALSLYDGKMFAQIRAYNELTKTKENLINELAKYRREDGLFGSQLLDKESAIDTSASAMILYMLGGRGTDSVTKEEISKYIREDGKVTQAQGECMGLGIYSETYDSYPWSVGMMLLLSSKW